MSKDKGIDKTWTRVNRFPRWRARISWNGKRHYLGRFVHKEDAQFAYNEAVAKLKSLNA